MNIGRLLSRCLVAALPVAAILPVVPAVSAGELNTVYSFCSQALCKDGHEPYGLSADHAGNLFGAVYNRGGGIIFELVQGKDYRLAYRFVCSHGACPNGDGPNASLVFDTQGNLYGVAGSGGTGGSNKGGGVAFELSPNGNSWTYKKLHDFCAQKSCPDGLYPSSGLTYAGAASGAPYDGQSPLFGVTSSGGTGGNGGGTAYQLVPNGDGTWSHSVLYSFCTQGGSLCTDGSLPRVLLPDANGNLLGTTEIGGTNLNTNGQVGAGVAFELSPAESGWRYSVLYNFCALANCADGQSPGSLVRDANDGTLYGLTDFGGAPCQEQNLQDDTCGVLFRLTQKGSRWRESVLYTFCQEADCEDGALPMALLLEPNGVILGTTWAGGGNDTDGNHVGSGVLFEHRGRNYQVLHSFCSLADCADGQIPYGSIVQDNGAVFGATIHGGSKGQGVVFEYTSGKR